MNHINFWKPLWEWLSTDMNNSIQSLEILSNVRDIKDRVSLITNIWWTNEKKFIQNYKEKKEIQELKMKFYNKFLDDLEFLYWKDEWKILIQVPSTHSKDFIPLIIERKHNSNSRLSKIDLEYIILDTESISKVWDSKIELMNLYVNYIKKYLKQINLLR